MQIIELAIDKLVPNAKISYMEEDSLEKQYNSLIWMDERERPSLEDLKIIIEENKEAFERIKRKRDLEPEIMKIKAKASREILDIAPIHKQLNAIVEAMMAMKDGKDLNKFEELYGQIKKIRDASNEEEERLLNENIPD